MVTLLQSFPLEVLPNGDNEIRTRDPLLARQVLSQLSYTPIKLLLSKNQNVLQVLSFLLDICYICLTVSS